MRVIFIGGPMDRQERVGNSAEPFRFVRLPSGDLVSYGLLLSYDDTVVYSHQLSLHEALDRLANHYLGDTNAP
jgi:hypothetical protein